MALEAVFPPAFGGLGATELIIILAIVVILFGASRIPNLMRGMGKGIVEFKGAMNEAKKVADDKEKAEKKEVEGSEKKELEEPSEKKD